MADAEPPRRPALVLMWRFTMLANLGVGMSLVVIVGRILVTPFTR
jgi:hypothetical protein